MKKLAKQIIVVLLVALMLQPMTAFASRGRLRSNTIKWFNGRLYGAHANNGRLHWHEAQKAADGYYYPVHNLVYYTGDPADPNSVLIDERGGYNPTPHTPGPSYQEGWKYDAGGYWYQLSDGSFYKSSWQSIGGVWYHFRSNGYLSTNTWVDNCYYVDQNGYMLKNTFTPDGYRVGADGAYAPGSWQRTSGAYWYQFSDGYYYANGWYMIDGEWFHFQKNGYLSTGRWIDQKYYVDQKGYMLKNAFTPDGYRVDADGIYAAGKWQIDSKGYWYSFRDGYFYRDGWKQIAGRWYHFRKDGYLSTSTWVGKYYMGADGEMLKETWSPDGYWLGADGVWDQTVERRMK